MDSFDVHPDPLLTLAGVLSENDRAVLTDLEELIRRTRTLNTKTHITPTIQLHGMLDELLTPVPGIGGIFSEEENIRARFAASDGAEKANILFDVAAAKCHYLVTGYQSVVDYLLLQRREAIMRSGWGTSAN